MNKTSILIISALILSSIIYLSSGCKKDEAPAVTEFTILVDSVQHADTIIEGEAFKVDFYGKVGDNDCYDFSKVEHAFDVKLIEVRLIGTHTARTDCVDGIQYMNPASVNFSNLPPGDWTFRVNQPEGQAPLESSFFVK